MDDFGLYYEGMLTTINQLERATPSSNDSEYVGRYETYMTQNLIPYDFMDFVIDDFEFYAELADIIRTLNSSDPALTVGQIIVVEDIIAETTLLTDLEKAGLLAFASLRKFVIATAAKQGVVVMGDVLAPGDARLNCFDMAFSIHMSECVTVFTDFDNPVLMGFAWAGMPAAMTGCIGNSTYRAIRDCW